MAARRFLDALHDEDSPQRAGLEDAPLRQLRLDLVVARGLLVVVRHVHKVLVRISSSVGSRDDQGSRAGQRKVRRLGLRALRVLLHPVVGQEQQKRAKNARKTWTRGSAAQDVQIA